ncbi:putative protein kinase domain, PPM-type phosphatase domain, protein kinase-like domain superfamily [Plasmopara halstedii]
MGCTASKLPLLPPDCVALSIARKGVDGSSDDEREPSKVFGDAEEPADYIANDFKEVGNVKCDYSERNVLDANGSPLKSLIQHSILADTQPEKTDSSSMLRDVSYSMRSSSDHTVTLKVIDEFTQLIRSNATETIWNRDGRQNMAQLAASRLARDLVNDSQQQTYVESLPGRVSSPHPCASKSSILTEYRASQGSISMNDSGLLSATANSRNPGHVLAQDKSCRIFQQSPTSSSEKQTTANLAYESLQKEGSGCIDDSEEDLDEDEEVEEWNLDGGIEVLKPGLKLNDPVEMRNTKAVRMYLSNTDFSMQKNAKVSAAPLPPGNRVFGRQTNSYPQPDVSNSSKDVIYNGDSGGSDEDDGEVFNDYIHDWLASPRASTLIPSLTKSGVGLSNIVTPLKSAHEPSHVSTMANSASIHQRSRHLYGLTIVPPTSDPSSSISGNVATSPLPPRHLPGYCLALGDISPTKRGLPVMGTPSPKKEYPYGSGNNFALTGIPLVVSGEQSPIRSALSPNHSPVAAAIRDTSIVKKKRAEIPQHNLPHPIPKFGDWLNSRTMINNYIILESLGVGGYAEVKLCKEKQSGKLYAMKFINRDVMKKDKLGKQSKLDDIKREIAIMKKLNHPNVLRLYEVMDDPKMNKLFLVLEYMQHGDMLSFQKKKHPLNMLENLRDRDLHCIFLQVILGLAYLHEQKIVHGDIKPQNLLVGDRDIVKIADFGISQSLYGSKQKIMDVAGTPAFMAPEMCSGKEYSGQLADVWALGATVFMLKFGNPPFVAKSAMVMFERIQNDPLVFPGAIDPLLAHLLKGMLTKSPLERMTLLDVMIHPWVTKNEKHSLALDAIYHPSRPITVSTDEIERAVGADHIAIVLNIHKQMYQRLEHARENLSEKKKLKTTDWNVGQSPKAVNAKNAARTNRVFIASSEMVAGVVESSIAGERKVLSSEEIDYRSQMFSRKKASNKNALEPIHKGGNYNCAVALSHHLINSGNDGVDDDGVSDDDELAVSQSPQLLDELLLTTLSMPPLASDTSPLLVNKNDSSNKGAISTATVTQDPPLNVYECRDDPHFYGESSALALSYGVSSLKGRRNTQEDRWVVIPSIATVFACRDGEISQWAKEAAYVGLYDGHGGEECANILHEQLHTWIFKAQDVPLLSVKDLQDCFESLDVSVCDYLVHKDDLSGSTATALVLRPAANGNIHLTIAHVGDCRLVLGKCDGSVVELTLDHRLTVDVERERILKLGGHVVNNRVNGVMAITRAFGDLEFKGLLDATRGASRSRHSFGDAGIEKVPSLLTAKPDVINLDLNRQEDEFLLLACDGLWDVMTSEEAISIFRDRLRLHKDLQLAAHELAQEGIRRYSNDNVTVIAISLKSPVSLF